MTPANVNIPGRQKAVTLLELVVVAAIIGILLIVVYPFFGGQRGRQAVSTAVDLTEGLLSRAQEEARTGGYPIDIAIKSSGLAAPSSSSASGTTAILVRVSRRLTTGNPVKVLSQRELPNSNLLNFEATELGQLTAGQQSDFLGVWIDIVRKTDTGESLLASIPVDVNGEFVLFTTASQARLTFAADGYEKSLTIERTGAFRSQ